MLINLTHNAVYAMKHGGGSRLRISAAREGPDDAPRVRLTVMDDGPGVAPQDVDRLFDAFFTTKPPSDGTGLGLPVSYGIVRSHGGLLRYLPSAFGRGAAFTFDLPVHGTRDAPDGQLGRDPHLAPPAPDAEPSAAPAAEPDADRPAAEPDADRPAAPTTPPAGPSDTPERPVVLVVDDEASIRIFLDRALRSLGYAALVTERGADALVAAGNAKVSVVLCDHQMAGMTGIEVYEGLGRIRPDLLDAFVIMSGDVQNPELAAFTSAHAVSVLAKPFELEALDRAVRGALAATQPRG